MGGDCNFPDSDFNSFLLAICKFFTCWREGMRPAGPGQPGEMGPLEFTKFNKCWCCTWARATLGADPGWGWSRTQWLWLWGWQLIYLLPVQFLHNNSTIYYPLQYIQVLVPPVELQWDPPGFLNYSEESQIILRSQSIKGYSSSRFSWKHTDLQSLPVQNSQLQSNKVPMELF